MITYDVRYFDYNDSTRTFTADAYQLSCAGYLTTFPSARQAFDIYNSFTNEARTFEFVEETDEYCAFVNEEENLSCIVFININHSEIDYLEYE